MIRRPTFVVAAEWDTMSDAKKRKLAAMHEATMDEEEMIDPVLRMQEPRGGRIHNADRDGPNGVPFETGRGRSPARSVPPVRSSTSAREHGGDRIGTTARSSRSRSPRRGGTSRSDGSITAPVPNPTTPSVPSEQIGVVPQVIANQVHTRDDVAVPESGCTGSCRGQVSNRGTSIRTKRRVRKEVPSSRYGGDEEEVPEGYEHLKWKKGDLSKDAQAAKAFLQRRVGAKFRAITNVARGKKWPENADEIRLAPETGERYYTPDFKKTVADEANIVLFDKVAELVWTDITSDGNRIPALKNAKIIWTKATLVEFAKDSFRGFRNEFKAQTNADKGKQKLKNQRTNRWLQRRIEKCNRLASVIDNYAEKYGVDVTNLLVQDHMSDEASGGEGEEEPSDAWKGRMARAAFGATVDEDQLKSLKFFEVIKPSWRSLELSDIFHELYKMWLSLLSTKQRESIRIMRVTTGRKSDEPPLVAPFNFGIDEDWLENEGPSYARLIGDWGTYEDPEGFGTKKRQTDIEAMEHD